MIAAPLNWLRGSRTDDVRHHLLWDSCIIIATIPAVIVGLTFKSRIEQLFTSVLVVYLMLIITGCMMILSRYAVDRQKSINGTRAFLIGCAQACAIMPGLSRSGSTIFVGMLLGVNRETVARFSFIMSIPAILGAAVLNIGEVFASTPSTASLVNLAAGTGMAAVTGWLAIKLLLDIIRRNRLPWFGYYCIAVAAVGLTTLALAR